VLTPDVYDRTKPADVRVLKKLEIKMPDSNSCSDIEIVYKN